MMSDYKVDMIDDDMQEVYVHFHGPNDSKHFNPVSQYSIFMTLNFSSFTGSFLFWVFADETSVGWTLFPKFYDIDSLIIL